MVEISKHLFEETCKHVDCHTILHPWHESCFKAGLMAYKESFIGSCKFYAIVYLAQIAMRGKKMFKSKKEWYKMGEYYARSTLLGCLVCGSACTLGCILRRLNGSEFGYYSYVMIPNMINGLAIYLEPPSRRGLVINLFCNLIIEYWIKVLEQANIINMTRNKQTLMFMVGSSLLFYLMRLEGDKNQRTSLFWFFTPEKVKLKTEDNKGVCPHEGPCSAHIIKGFSKLFSAGFAITLARVVLPKIRTPIKALSLLRFKHLKMAAFFGFYIGIYRTVICLLCQKRGYDSALYALPAGYLAGMSFLFNPSLGFAIGSLTAAFKLYSTILYEKKILPDNIPLPEMLYCFCQGTLFHTRIMHPEICPKYVFNLMRTVSNGTADFAIRELVKITCL